MGQKELVRPAPPPAAHPAAPPALPAPAQPPTPKSVPEAGSGNGQHCPQGQYRVQGVVWECGQTKNKGAFQLPAGSTQNAISVPAGVKNFGFKTSSSEPLSLAVVDMATRITALRGGDQHFVTEEYQGVTITYSVMGNDPTAKEHVASIWIEGAIASPLSIQVVSTASTGEPAANVKMDYLYSKIEPCPAEPLGCRAYDAALGRGAAVRWSCAAASALERNGVAVGSAWETLAGAHESAGQPLPWYAWPAVWQRAGAGGGADDWKLGFAFIDLNRDAVISRSEFEAAIHLCSQSSPPPIAQAPPAHPPPSSHMLRAPAASSTSTSSSGGGSMAPTFAGAIVVGGIIGIVIWYLRSRNQSKGYSVKAGSDGLQTQSAARSMKIEPPQMTPRTSNARRHGQYDTGGRTTLLPCAAPQEMSKRHEDAVVYAPIPPTDPVPTATMEIQQPRPQPEEKRACDVWSGLWSCAGWRRSSASATWDCGNCGHRMQVNNNTCSKCGAPRPSAPKQAMSMPSDWQTTVENRSVVSVAEETRPYHQEHSAAATRAAEVGDVFLTESSPPPASHHGHQREQEQHHAERHHMEHQPQPQDHHHAAGHQEMAAAYAPGPAEQSLPEDSVEGVVQAMRRNKGRVEDLTRHCRYLAEVAKDAGGQEEVMRCGADAAVLEAMDGHKNALDLQIEACTALRNFVVEREDFADRIASCHGVDTVLRVMRVNLQSADLVEKACWVLQQLSLTEAGRRSIAVDEGTGLVAKGMEIHRATPGVQESGSLTIGNLAFDEPLREQISRSHSVHAIVLAMREHELDEGVQEAGVFALHNIACSQDLVGQIAQVGGKETLIRAIQNNPNIEEREEAQATIEMLEYMEQEAAAEQG